MSLFIFVNYSCTVTKITRTRLNLVCEALSAICSTSRVQIFVSGEPEENACLPSCERLGKFSSAVFCVGSNYILHVCCLQTECVFDICGLDICCAWFEFR